MTLVVVFSSARRRFIAQKAEQLAQLNLCHMLTENTQTNYDDFMENAKCRNA